MSDLVIVLVIVLVLVVIWRGPRTFPEIGRMFGRGVREAREEIGRARTSDESPADESKPTV